MSSGSSGLRLRRRLTAGWTSLATAGPPRIQPLMCLLSPRQRWVQTSESRHGKKFIQDDHIETDPLANMPRGLVHVTGSERHIISHQGSHSHLEIRIQRTLQASSNSPPLEETVIPARVMGPACVADQRKPFDLTERVLNTMAEARATSTRCLYALKLSIFSG